VSTVADFIGKPWRAGATGPDAYDCYGLARAASRALFGRDLPETLDDAQGWAPVPVAQDGDVVLMGAAGDKHIGLVVHGQCLHSLDPVGAVFESFVQLRFRGFSRLRFYRSQCPTI
jgi:cell wall-associated NlpC family hydrolase